MQKIKHNAIFPFLSTSLTLTAHWLRSITMVVKLTKKEFEVYQKDFCEFDADANGALEGEECRACAKKQLAGTEFTEEQVDALVKEFDKNGDGKIELDEYITKILGDTYEIAGGADESESRKAVSKLTKNDIGELKSLMKPPDAVMTTITATVIILDGAKPKEWKDCQKVIADRKFLERVKTAPFEPLSAEKKKLLEPLVGAADFTPETVTKSSMACGSLCGWVKALYAL